MNTGWYITRRTRATFICYEFRLDRAEELEACCKTAAMVSWTGVLERDGEFEYNKRLAQIDIPLFYVVIRLRFQRK